MDYPHQGRSSQRRFLAGSGLRPHLEPIEVQPIPRKRMKLLASLSILLLLPVPSLAGGNHSQRGYSQEQTCYENTYREEYIPGTSRNPGYIKRHRERVVVPCENSGPQYYPQERPQANQDTNSCLEGSIIGALLGGGIGGAVSRGEGRWIGVPGGAVAGALIGCQVDGG